MSWMYMWVMRLMEMDKREQRLLGASEIRRRAKRAQGWYD